jgi:hypothetical protein
MSELTPVEPERVLVDIHGLELLVMGLRAISSTKI